jgi:catechol 2,3-dioxygenase-like lactoylglutathione lyase family enzyme
MLHCNTKLIVARLPVSLDGAGIDEEDELPTEPSSPVTQVGDLWIAGERREFESHHYAFHVSDAEFDAIFGRIREAKLAYGSAPWSLDDGKLNGWNGGRGVYFRDADGHVLELMTVPE